MKSASFQTLKQQDGWTVHLRDVFDTMAIPSGTQADHVSASVAMYCREFLPNGVQRTDLVLLIARAFCAINDQETARRVLQSLPSHHRHVERWLEILSELHRFPDLLPYFSLGIIRPADWAGAQLDRMWTLDFERLALSDAEKHEMMLYRSIRAIIQHMYIFWDATDGEGTLGLKGLASMNVEAQSRSKQTLTASDDLIEYISDLFLQQKSTREWSAVPSLMNLDL